MFDKDIRLPLKIDPCPIVESLVEIRFQTDIPSDAIFGFVYSSIKGEYSEYTKLPILQIPDQIRSSDPAFEFSPYYKFSRENFLFQIGPKVWSLNCINEYVGWDNYFKEIEYCIEKLKEIKIINNFVRMGIRYINLFDVEILKHINLNLIFNSKPLYNKNTIIKTEFDVGRFKDALHVVSDAEITRNDKKDKGSVIDIHTFIPGDGIDFDKEIYELIQEGHTEEKKLFFSLLKEDFLETLNPQY